MATVRRNQADLSKNEQKAFVGAVNALHGTGAAAPAYRAFVQVHVDAMSMNGVSWGVHTMPGMGMVGRNFLCWHRRFLSQFEQRLQAVDATLSVPYWDWIANPVLPTFLTDPALLSGWSVTRSWDPSQLPVQADVDAATSRHSFSTFQRKLELGAHGDVHVAVGGTMDTASSPADPVFWLHHANIDRLWARWQTDHPTTKTPHAARRHGAAAATAFRGEGSHPARHQRVGVQLHLKSPDRPGSHTGFFLASSPDGEQVAES